MAKTVQKAVTFNTDNAQVTSVTTATDTNPLAAPYDGKAGITYTGARYVPIFATPTEWNKQSTYEPLTIVTYEGNSYTSKQYVPVGVDINNDDFWALTGNYNAQVEAYKQIVESFNDRINDNLNTVQNLEHDLGYTFNTDSKLYVFSDSTFQRNGNIKSIVEYMEELSDITIDNRGAGGSNTEYLYNLLNGYSSSELQDATHIIVAYGINDFQGNRQPLCVNYTSYNNFVTYFETLYGKCLDKLCALAPQAQIICVTPAYIHYEVDNSINPININTQGNTFYSYCDIIRQEAYKRNIGVLSLDKIMGINESNYTSKLVVSSGTKIWVHHNAKTNEEIAKIILFKQWENVGNQNSYIDVTPLNAKNYFGDVFTFINTMKTNANDTFKVHLYPGVDYWFTCLSGYINIKLNGITILANNRSYSSMQASFKVDTEGDYTVSFEANTSSVSIPHIANILISIGRPNIYVIGEQASLGGLVYENDNERVNITRIGNIYGGTIGLKNETLAPTTISTAIANLEKWFYDQPSIFGLLTGTDAVTNTGFTSLCRVEYYRGETNIYLSTTNSNPLKNVTIRI